MLIDTSVSAALHPQKPPPPTSTTPLTATLFYKSSTPNHAHPHPDLSPHKASDTIPSASLESLKDGAIPTENMDSYPLEPPTPGPDPLDHLYGAYISQSCLTGFYDALKDTIQDLDEDAIRTKVLDGGKMPRVVEIEFSIPSDSVAVSSAGLTEQKNDASLETLRRDETISRFEREWNVEVVFQRSSIHRRYKRLAIFDMDSTLIQQEVIDEIAALIGVEAEVSAITARAMNGELDFEASLRQRCALLKGVPGDLWEKLKPKITLNNGVKELILALKRLGFKTGVLSGGFTPLTGWLAGQLGLDYAFANHLVLSDDGQSLTGELVGEIVHAERKRQHVLDIAKKEGVLLDQVLVVGDGANDLPMMGVAGLGVAFNAKPNVQLQAPSRLNSTSMLDVLFLLGISREEMNELFT